MAGRKGRRRRASQGSELEAVRKNFVKVALMVCTALAAIGMIILFVLGEKATAGFVLMLLVMLLIAYSVA